MIKLTSDTIKAWWPVVLLLGSFLMGWTTLGNEQHAIKLKTEKIENKQIEIQEKVTELDKIDVSTLECLKGIQNSINNINVNLSKTGENISTIQKDLSYLKGIQNAPK